MAIRTLGPGDAEDFAALLEALDRETEYLMFEPGERSVDLDALGRRLANRDPAAGLLYALVIPRRAARARPTGRAGRCRKTPRTARTIPRGAGPASRSRAFSAGNAARAGGTATRCTSSSRSAGRTSAAVTGAA